MFPRILVLDQDGMVANTIAALVSTSTCEIVACQDFLAAQRATDMVSFDFVFINLCRFEQGPEQLAVVDPVLEADPTALIVVIAPKVDAHFKAAARRRGAFAVLTRSSLQKELTRLCQRLGIDRLPRTGRGTQRSRGTDPMAGLARAT